ncbi:MAG TPA: DUF6428 family protein [Bacteroidia bacterium]|jgi:hypothetical protein|nr:DUF6428 family protein [Bacteroidia bacterium]HRG53958.1 DUF6428 family protein [Bacteroidia bacterium]
MKLSEIKKHLSTATAVNFLLENGTAVPEHFHVTEVGVITKNFIDCGGTVRNEKVANFQLWNANDTDHRLKPKKLLDIIALSEKVLAMEDSEIEVEYQSDTIGKYGLDFRDGNFVLTTKQTDCLAKDNCGVPDGKQKVKLSDLNNETQPCCAPGCCN